MATDKANRKSSQHSAVNIQRNQNQRRNPAHPFQHPTEAPQPVKAHIYRTLAELNGGFEKVVQDLKTLQQVGFLRSERLSGMHDLICGIRAQANRECLSVLEEREEANAGHFGHPRAGSQQIAPVG